MALAYQWERDGRIPLGIFYQDESRPAYHESVKQLEVGPLVKQALKTDLKDSFKAFV